MNNYDQTRVSKTASTKIPINLEKQIIDLREKNSVLAQKVQYWRSVAAQKDREKLDCMKEINELRIQISKYRKNGLGLEKKFESAVNELGANSLTRLVEVSGFIAQIINLTDIHKKEREDLQNDQLSTKVKKSVNKIRRVEPMIGGLSIKPFVALRRAVINSTHVAAPAADEDPTLSDESSNEDAESEPSDNLPLLQELYVPLHRIDVDPRQPALNSLNDARSVPLSPSNVEYEEDLPLNLEQIEEEITEGNQGQDERSNDVSDDVAFFELHRVEEQPVENNHVIIDSNISNWNPQVLLERSLNNAAINNSTPRRSQTEVDPLEGPSWLLDLNNSVRSSNSPTFNSGTNIISNFLNPESCESMQIPDSTTSVQDAQVNISQSSSIGREQGRKKCRLFSITNNLENVTLDDSDSDSDDNNWKPSRKKLVSKKKRKNELKDPRSVKVLVSKINEKHLNAALSPRAMKKRKAANEQTERTPKRTARPNLDTPSPNGSTVPQMFISENSISFLPQFSGGDTTEEDSQRQRRQRSTPTSYKEKPLNRKLRRS